MEDRKNFSDANFSQQGLPKVGHKENPHTAAELGLWFSFLRSKEGGPQERQDQMWTSDLIRGSEA